MSKVISYEKLNQLCECLKNSLFCESMDLADGLDFLKCLLPMCEIREEDGHDDD